jgi:hypothetical protein
MFDSVDPEPIDHDSTSSVGEEDEEPGSPLYSADTDEDNLPEEGFEDIVGEDDGFGMMVD